MSPDAAVDASSLTVSATSSATTDARHWTVAHLQQRSQHDPDVCDDAELVVSELVSNAVLHGRGPITVALIATPGQLLVEVADTGGPPYLFGGRTADPTASHGRGLGIVAHVAAARGIRARQPGPGKTVYGSLRTTPDTAG